MVEKLNKATGRWVPVGKTDDTEMEIKGLQEGEEYEFRVKAVNEEGESEPLKTDHSIIAKNPYGKLWVKLIFVQLFRGFQELEVFRKKRRSQTQSGKKKSQTDHSTRNKEKKYIIIKSIATIHEAKVNQ